VRPGKIPNTVIAGQVVRTGVERIHRTLNHTNRKANFASGIYINGIKQLKEDSPWTDQLTIHYLLNLIIEKDLRASRLPSLATHTQLTLFGTTAS